MESLVGYTGFVGSNIAKSHNFDGLYDSENVEESYGTKPDLLIYSGVPAQKFLANKDSEKDFKIIEGAIENIKKIDPKEVVLISTIDVYKNPNNVNEDTPIDTENLQPYGYNRYYLEKWVKENIKKHLVVHLPGLYGNNIKKNFIYDLIHIIPSMLSEQKYFELINKNDFIKDYYTAREDGFYELRKIDDTARKNLKEYFNNIGFSALNFTDSRGIFQFYPLEYLWKHIDIARKNNLEVLNLATEPVSIEQVYKNVYGKEFVNEITDNIPYYNFKTKYDYLYNGKDGYIFNKEFVLNDIKKFVSSKTNI